MRHHAAALRPRDSAFMEVGHTWTSARLREMLSHELTRSWVFFSASDTNGNGLLDRDEFRLAILGMRSDVPDAVCDAVFDEFDADSSGEISFDEFLRWMLRDVLRREAARAEQLFRDFDVDGTGSIEKWEFRRGLLSMGFNVPSIEMVDALFDSLDLDGNGSLSFNELFHEIAGVCRPRQRGDHGDHMARGAATLAPWPKRSRTRQTHEEPRVAPRKTITATHHVSSLSASPGPGQHPDTRPSKMDARPSVAAEEAVRRRHDEERRFLGHPSPRTQGKRTTAAAAAAAPSPLRRAAAALLAPPPPSLVALVAPWDPPPPAMMHVDEFVPAREPPDGSTGRGRALPPVGSANISSTRHAAMATRLLTVPDSVQSPSRGRGASYRTRSDARDPTSAVKHDQGGGPTPRIPPPPLSPARTQETLSLPMLRPPPSESDTPSPSLPRPSAGRAEARSLPMMRRGAGGPPA